MPDYKKVFASASPLNLYEWSDSNYLKGWDMVGSNPPTKQQFDALFRNIDEKENYLYSQIFNGTRLRRNGTNYAVGDRVYYTAMPTYLELECVTAGTTATAEVDVPAGIKAGDTLTDGTVIWKAIKYALTTDAPPLASALATPRKINGTNFDGTGNITTANWGTARNISIADATAANTGTGVSVNGSGNVTLKLPTTIKANLTGTVTGNVSGSSSSCTGNSATATKATQDSAGQQINTTYIKGLSASNATLTYTKGNGTTGTVTVNNVANATTAKTATNADTVDGYHASDLLRTFGGNKAPVMTDIFDRAGTIDLTTMDDTDKARHKARINKSQNAVQNLWNDGTGIHAYGGDVNMANDYKRGTLKLTQSYKNFDKILVVACDDDANVIKYRIWDVWELAHAFNSCFAFDILGTNIFWEIFGSVRTGDNTDYVLSTDTIWNCYNQRSGIIAIYGIKY